MGLFRVGRKSIISKGYERMECLGFFWCRSARFVLGMEGCRGLRDDLLISVPDRELTGGVCKIVVVDGWYAKKMNFRVRVAREDCSIESSDTSKES